MPVVVFGIFVVVGFFIGGFVGAIIAGVIYILISAFALIGFALTK